MAAVVLENIGVDFPIYGTQRSFRKAIFERATGGLIQRGGKNHDHVTVKALTGISLELQDGDRLGLIGHNGSGKSTLLKVIAGIYEPTDGHLRVKGRVTPLFDTMPGLDGEDTGYENIITAGLLIGLSRDQVENKIPEIEEFCELGEYLSLPVRTYSLGMTMRLGFALATALDPGVLLMDEGFGTGDLRFAERAEARMNEFIGRSRIMVLASHSDATIRSMCNKAALMQEGRLLAIGLVDDIYDQYLTMVHGSAASHPAATGITADIEPSEVETELQDLPECPPLELLSEIEAAEDNDEPIEFPVLEDAPPKLLSEIEAAEDNDEPIEFPVLEDSPLELLSDMETVEYCEEPIAFSVLENLPLELLGDMETAEHHEEPVVYPALFGRIDLTYWKNRTNDDVETRIGWAEIFPGADREKNHSMYVGSDLLIRFQIDLSSEKIGQSVKSSVVLTSTEGLPIANVVCEDSNCVIRPDKGTIVASVFFHDLRLYPGKYNLGLWVGSQDSTTSDYVHDCLQLEILEGGALARRRLPREAGLLFLTPEWQID